MCRGWTNSPVCVWCWPEVQREGRQEENSTAVWSFTRMSWNHMRMDWNMCLSLLPLTWWRRWPAEDKVLPHRAKHTHTWFTYHFIPLRSVCKVCMLQNGCWLHSIFQISPTGLEGLFIQYGHCILQFYYSQTTEEALWPSITLTWSNSNLG